MAQLFHKATNSLSKASVLIVAGVVVIGLGVFDVLYTSPYINDTKVFREQPVPFSHKHHVMDDGIDCRYCHTSVENSYFAGIPPVKTCMTCHSQLFTHAPMLEPIREAYKTGAPVKWVRVNWLPGYVYFDHSIHVNKGIGCTVCHGPVGDMPLTFRQVKLEMRWCLQCHTNPAAYVRPESQVFNAFYQQPSSKDQKALGEWLVKEYHIKKLTDCYTCHR